MIPEVFSNHKVTSYSVVPVLTQAATFSETPAESIKIVINIRDVTYDTRIFFFRLKFDFFPRISKSGEHKRQQERDLWTQNKYSLS